MSVELGERHYVALGRLGLPVVRRWRDPLGDDSEVRWRSSPSLSSSNNRRSVIDDGRQSSVAMSLTGISDGSAANPLLHEEACA